MTKTSRSQIKASHRWTNKHKNRQIYYQKKSYTKNFVLKNASIKDVKQVREWCKQRIRKLNSK